MKNKKTFLLLLLIFVLLIGGAVVLYDTLGEKVMPNQLGVVEQTATTEPAPSEAAASEAPQTPAETAPPAETAVPTKILAPDFVAYDGEGKSVSLANFKGKPIIINFWASWCEPCQSEMSAFEEMWHQYGDQVQFVMVNQTDGSRETKKTAEEFLADAGYTFPVLFDTAGSASVSYGASSIPMTFFIDAEGYAIAYHAGPLNKEMLEYGVQLVLTGAA